MFCLETLEAHKHVSNGETNCNLTTTVVFEFAPLIRENTL